MIIVISNLQGVWGFISGGLTWFAIPFSLATTMGLAYLGLSSAQGAPLLSDEDVAKGKLKIKAIQYEHIAKTENYSPTHHRTIKANQIYYFQK